ncbi:MAG TPA: autotransporter outer membrane beta-barrel domain-containing protein, partial [Brevundimonas sp.]|nr:autotransporter outer membrane beta-barrel domain-containing protein [Brevundimonas sp.]
GGTGAGNITVLSDNLVRGGTGAGVGIRLSGGASNLIRTSGSVSAISGLAIDTGAGDDRVENTGAIFGNIDLGSGTNAVLNGVGGTFLAFNAIDLQDGPGSSGVFTNAGDFVMGLSASRTPIDLANGATFGDLDAEGDPSTNLYYGARVINTVALDGDYVQTGTGHLVFDVAYGPYASDRVNATSDATVDGTGEVILTWLENSDRVTLFATGGVGVDHGLEIEDTLAMDYRIEADADGVHLAFNTHFGQGFLNRNGQALGHHMDSAIAAGGSAGIGQLMALIGNLQVGDEATYSYIFNELNPEPLLAPTVTQFSASRDFADQIFNCGSDLAPANNRCAWAQIETSEFEREGDSEFFGITADAVARFRTGFEQPVGGGWVVGGAFGYDDLGHNFVDNGRAVFEGDGFHSGLGLRQTAPDGGQMGVSISAGWQSVETTRVSNVFQPLTGESNNDTGYLRMDAEVAHIFGTGGFYVRPALRGSVTALYRDGFVEEGMAGLGVEGFADTEVIGTLNPEVAFGFRSDYGQGSSASAAFTLGRVFHSEDELVAPMRLLGSNPDAAPAFITTPIEEQAWRVGADVRFGNDNGLSLRLNYVGEFGDKVESHTVGANLRMKF